MFLQKVEIQGFKSFARKTVLEFNRQFTAIVGPNGSGKSNVADAIRWVLGEQSLKTLRGKKAEDVIFAGSDKKSRLGMAEVSLYLNNENGLVPIEFGELVITRRIFRDGQSEYLLNNSQVRLQDIQLLLARANIGQRTYSVIGQGMIDSILSSSPAERKEFFEDATGVKQYQLKRDQAINKLTATYVNLEQASLLLQEIEPRLRVLTRQVKRLEHREELTVSLRQQQKDYYRYRYWYLERSRLVIGKTCSEMEVALLSQQNLIKDLRAKLNAKEKSVTVSSAWQKLQSQQAELRVKIGQLTKDLAVAQAAEEIGHFKKGEGEIAWLKQRLAEVERELNEAEAKETDLQNDLLSKRRLLALKTKERTQVAVLFDALDKEEKPDWLNKDLEIWLAQATNLSSRFDQAVDLSAVAVLAEELKKVIKKIAIILERLKKPAGSSKADFTKTLEHHEGLINELASLTAEIASLEKSVVSLKEIANRLRDTKIKVEKSLQVKPTKVSDVNQTNEIKKSLINLENQINQIEVNLAQFHTRQEAKEAELFNLQRELETATSQELILERKYHESKVEQARIETRLEDLEHELAQETTVELVREIKEVGEVKLIDEGIVALELQKLKRQLELTGGIEPEVVTEYQQTKTRFDFLTSQTGDLEQAAKSLESIIQDLDKTIEKKFTVDFNRINDKFTEYFKVLFSGGRAQLNLQKNEPVTEQTTGESVLSDQVDSTNQEPVGPKQKFLLNEKIRASLFSGVDIQATPPGKKLSSITALSGGEKALTSIALISAIISCNPSPFVVLDEVDAALDESNSERFAAILEKLNKQTQFITITHNRATMRQADILYGVTMDEDGVSKLLSVKLEEAKQIAE
ncbi:AAA family ATPase [Patescibacteria group bacterium]|nr:AAA family ATPase [Patescibacteria group bacterium]